MIPGIVAQITPAAAIPPAGGSPVLVSGQIASRRGPGTITLPAAPTPGNLIVILVCGSQNTPAFPVVSGFLRCPLFVSQFNPFSGSVDAAENSAVGAFYRVAQTGDTGSFSLPTGNLIATIYEFSDAHSVAPVVGGNLTPFMSGGSFSANVNASPYGEKDLLIGGVIQNENVALVLDTISGVTQDYSNTSPLGSFGGCIFRVTGSLPPAISGTGITSGVTSARAYGLFAILSSSTPE